MLIFLKALGLADLPIIIAGDPEGLLYAIRISRSLVISFFFGIEQSRAKGL